MQERMLLQVGWKGWILIAWVYRMDSKKKLLLNLTDIHQIYSRLGLLPSKFIASKLLKYRNKPPDFKDLNYCLTYNSLKQATATCFSGFQINPKT